MFRFFWQVSSVGRRKVVKTSGFGRWSSDPAASCLGIVQNIVVTHWAGKPRTETSFKPRLSSLTRVGLRCGLHQIIETKCYFKVQRNISPRYKRFTADLKIPTPQWKGITHRRDSQLHTPRNTLGELMMKELRPYHSKGKTGL